MTTGKKRLLVAAAIAAAAAVFACVLFFCDPMTSTFYPRCPSKLLTGYDCPGCGTTRALHALVHLDFGAALRYNAALFVLGPLLLLYVAASFTAYDSRLNRFLRKPALAWGIVAFIVVWTVSRNVVWPL